MPYGTLGLDVLQSSTAGTPPQFNDGNGTQVGTLCRAWVNFNSSSGSSCVTNASFNVTSVTYNATGDYTVNFTTAMTDTNYAVIGYGQRTDAATPPVLFSGSTAGSTYLTTSVRVRASYPWTNATYVDCLKACIAVFR